MNFKELENQFWQLKGKQSAGVLSDEDFRSEVANLRLQDDEKQWWTLNPKDGKWLVYKGQKWVAGVPPQEKPEEVVAPPPPPPPPPPQKESVPNEGRPRPKRKPRPRSEAPVDDPVPEAVPEPPRPKSPPTRPRPTRPIVQSKNQDPVPPPPPAQPGRAKTSGTRPPVSKPKPSMDFCPKCKAEIARDDKFCGDCGQILLSKQQLRENRANPSIREEKHIDKSSALQPGGKKKAVNRTWLIGGLIYMAVIYFLLLVFDVDITNILGPYTLPILDVLAAIIIFTLILGKNGIKVKFQPRGTPGRDMFFLLGFGLLFALITQGLGPVIWGFVGGFLVELINLDTNSTMILIPFIGVNYIIYVLAGVLLSILGLNMAPKVLKKSVNN